MKELVTKLIESKTFKIVTFILSLTFFISTFFIKFDQELLNNGGYLGILFFNMVSSGILLIPKLIHQVDPIIFTIVSAVGMTIGESVNWYVGYVSNHIIKEVPAEKKLEAFLKRYIYAGIFFLALIPFPFDMIGTFAGRLNTPFLKYISLILAARIIRFSIIVYTFLFLI